MSAAEKWVTSTDALVAALKDETVERVVVSGRLANSPTIRLAPEKSVCGAAEDSTIAFADDANGIELSSDNSIGNLHLKAAPEKRAIFNDTTVPALGRIALHSVTTTGRVQILARDNVRGGHVDVNGLDIVAADARAELERPQGYGVHVLQGGFTLWNLQSDAVAIAWVRYPVVPRLTLTA
jgi:hypothetical protein